MNIYPCAGQPLPFLLQTEAMSLDLDRVTVEVPCPNCGYGVGAQLLDVRTQVWRWCPCCRARIRLVEPDGTVSGSIKAVDQALQSLTDTLKRTSR